MSQLYKKYALLKIQNSSKLYLFECGIFYVFIHDDALLMSNILGLKLTQLNSFIKKCGFPINSSNKYFNILEKLDYDIEIVPASSPSSPVDISTYIMNKNYEIIIDEFLKLNVEDVSISQAFEVLSDLQAKFKHARSNQFEKER